MSSPIRPSSPLLLCACLAAALASCGDSSPDGDGDGGGRDARADTGGSPGDAGAPGDGDVPGDSGVADGATPGDDAGSDGGALPVDAGSDSGAGPAGPGSVVTHHNGPSRDGLYVVPGLTRAAAAGLHEDPAFHASIDGPTYAHPLFYDAAGAGQDLVLVATEQNVVYALDATTGAAAWTVTLGEPVPLAELPCGNIDPLGVTGTPYLDVASRTLFLDAMMLDGGAPKHRIFALSLDDGSTRPGWPVDVETVAVFGGFTFDSSVQNQRGALLVQDGILYVPYGGHYGDCGAYRGWTVGVPLADPASATAWATRARGAGSWAPSGVASDGASLFVATGNGFGSTTWSDQEAIVRLAPGPTFSGLPADYFSPTSWMALDDRDLDLGGAGPVLIHVEGATPADVIVALGKDGFAYVLDRANLGGVGGAVAMQRVSRSPIVTASAAYPVATGVNVVYQGTGSGCPGGSGDVIALHLTAASPPAIETAWCASSGGWGSPIVTTTDGRSETIVWIVGVEGDNRLRGFDGDTGEELFDGAGTDVDSGNRYESPIVANGRFYFAGRRGVHAFTVE